MGQPASRGTEGTCGHGCYPPTVVSGSAATVKINGSSAMKVGDGMAPHVCVKKPYPVHGSAVAGGSGTVMVEGVPLGRIGDPIGCGDAIASGSSDVISG